MVDPPSAQKSSLKASIPADLLFFLLILVLQAPATPTTVTTCYQRVGFIEYYLLCMILVDIKVLQVTEIMKDLSK